jgi:hypothetical protein
MSCGLAGSRLAGTLLPAPALAQTPAQGYNC